MGTGHSADSPIRVGHLGISSVISLVDDILLYRLSKHYREEYGLPVVKVPAHEPDARAKRITVYLDTVDEIVGTASRIHTQSVLLRGQREAPLLRAVAR